MKRRVFLQRMAQASLLAGASGWTSPNAMGANERVRMGVIGCGGRGRYVVRYLREAGAQIVTLCDVYETQIRAANQELGGSCRSFLDFRNLLEANGKG